MYDRADENKKFKIDAILWFCLPNERADDTLKRQAKFIQKFTERTRLLSPCDIWKSVLIIFKGPHNGWNEGPKAAAVEAASSGDLKTFQFNMFQSYILGVREEDDDDDEEEEYRGEHSYTQKEVRRVIRERISTFPGIEVIFENKRCLKCDKRGDPNFLDVNVNNTCHPSMGHDLREVPKFRHNNNEMCSVHIGESSLVHPPNRRHLSGAEYVAEESGLLYPVGFLIGMFSRGVEKCRKCRGVIGQSEGCERQCNNCNRLYSEAGCRNIYKCCNTGGQGCISYTEEECVNKCSLQGESCICTECRRRVGTEGCSKSSTHEWIDINVNVD